MIWIAWLDLSDKWHCFNDGPYIDRMLEERARKVAKMLVGRAEGGFDLIGIAKCAYCVHAGSRHRAIKLAKDAFKRRLISE